MLKLETYTTTPTVVFPTISYAKEGQEVYINKHFDTEEQQLEGPKLESQASRGIYCNLFVGIDTPNVAWNPIPLKIHKKKESYDATTSAKSSELKHQMNNTESKVVKGNTNTKSKNTNKDKNGTVKLLSETMDFTPHGGSSAVYNKE